MLFLVSGAVPRYTDAAVNAVVSIYVDGEKQVVSTSAQTVGEALERSEVEVGAEDLVEPAPEEEISSNVFNINVYRARPVLVLDGEDEYRVTTPYQNPRLIVERSAEITVYKEDRFEIELVRDFLEEDHLGQRVIVHRATPIELTADGRTLTIRTHAPTVGEMLEEKDISLGGQDRVEPAADTPITAGMEITITRVGHETISEQKTIPRPVEVVLDNNQPIGYEKVRQEGRDGIEMVTYEVVYKDGQEASRKRLHGVILEEPEAKIIVTGNKGGSYTNDTQKLLYDLRMCETGGRYNANDGNGFYGAYQFMEATWNNLNTGYAYAHLAPPSVQDEAVLDNALRSAGGFWSQHPGCSQKLGLPQFP